VRRSGAATDLDPEDWELVSTGTTPIDGHPPAHMLDDNPGTLWTSGESQDTDLSLTVDLGSTQAFTELSLDVGADIGGYLRSYRVQVSDDGATWHSIVRGPGRTGEMIIALPETTARYVRISSTARSGSWWSIAELNIRRAQLSETPAPIGWALTRDRATLSDGSPVVGYYNAGRRTQTVPWPIRGFGYEYRLPPTAAATFVVPAP